MLGMWSWRTYDKELPNQENRKYYTDSTNTSSITSEKEPRTRCRRTSFLSQRYSSNQAQRRPRSKIDGRKRQTYNLTKEEAQMLERMGTGSGSQYLKLEP